MAQPIDPRQVKPGRRWYVVAVAIAVLCVVVGVGGFVAGVLSVAGHLPHLDQKSASGAALPVQLKAGQKFAVYVETSSTARASCTHSPSDGITVDGNSLSFNFTSGGQDWTLAEEASATTAGTYTYTCGGAPFAIGTQPEIGKFVGGIGIGLAALLGLPCFGLVIGTVIGVVVAVRRRNSRERLRATTPA